MTLLETEPTEMDMFPNLVIPVKTGIQSQRVMPVLRDSRLRRKDEGTSSNGIVNTARIPITTTPCQTESQPERRGASHRNCIRPAFWQECVLAS